MALGFGELEGKRLSSKFHYVYSSSVLRFTHYVKLTWTYLYPSSGIWNTIM